MPVIDGDQVRWRIPPECPVSAFGVATFKAGRPVDFRDHFHDADEFYWIAWGRDGGARGRQGDRSHPPIRPEAIQ